MKRSLSFVLSLAAAACILGTAPSQAQTAASSGALSAPLPAQIKARGRLIVGVKCDFPPLGYVDAAGEHVGFEIDLVHRLAELAFGKPDAVTLECVAGPNRIPFITSGRVDMIVSVLSYTTDRAKVIGFSEPYFDSGVKMIVPKNSTVANWSDVKGKTVTTTTGGTPAIWMGKCMSDVQVLPFDNTADSLAALKQGRAVAYAQDINLLVGIVSKDPSLKIVGDSEVRGPLNFGLKLGDTELKAWADAAVAEMTKADFFWTSLQKWIPASEIQGFTDAVPRPGGRQITNDEANDIYKCH